MLTVLDLERTFDSDANEMVRAVNGVSFDVRRGEFFTLLGPSGCGKTTTLRCVAGLEEPTGGSIQVADKTVYSAASRVVVPSNKRNIGMVFQSYAIWPHMTVAANISFPLRVQHKVKGRAAIQEKVRAALKTVGLEGYDNRSATKLSGGQQQRLALARALVWEPDLLLLDEPLSNLDAKLREDMRMELKRLQRELGITCVYVTHDQVEALALSDRIAVMQSGNILQIGTPREIYMHPANLFVATFVGNTNLIAGTVEETCVAEESCRVRTDHGLVKGVAGEALHTGQRVVVSVRPEDLTITPAGAADDRSRGVRAADANVNALAGRSVSSAFLGEMADYRVDVGAGQALGVREPNRSEVRDGDVVLVSAAVTSWRVLAADEAAPGEPPAQQTDSDPVQAARNGAVAP